MEHRDAVDNRKDAAVAAEDSVLNLVSAAAVVERVDQREPSAAVRAAEYVEDVNQHVG
jgi:hypothetical protein